jgi:hypothetical protein
LEGCGYDSDVVNGLKESGKKCEWMRLMNLRLVDGSVSRCKNLLYQSLGAGDAAIQVKCVLAA